MELLQTNKLDRVSITMICRNADVGKTTFYRYYSDKYDLINQMYDGFLPKNLDGLGKTVSWRDMMMVLFDSFSKNRSFLRQAYLSDDINNLENHSVDALRSAIETLLKNKGCRTTKPEVEYAISLLSFAGARLLKDWIMTGGSDTKEKLLSYLHESIPFIIYPYFD